MKNTTRLVLIFALLLPLVLLFQNCGTVGPLKSMSSNQVDRNSAPGLYGVPGKCLNMAALGVWEGQLNNELEIMAIRSDCTVSTSVCQTIATVESVDAMSGSGYLLIYSSAIRNSCLQPGLHQCSFAVVSGKLNYTCDGSPVVQFKPYQSVEPSGSAPKSDVGFRLVPQINGENLVHVTGKLRYANGSFVSGRSVNVRAQVKSLAPSSCVMYEEVFSFDMGSVPGVLDLYLGEETLGVRTDTSGLDFEEIFENGNVFYFNPASCSSGNSYQPTPDAGRLGSLSFRDETMADWISISNRSVAH